MKIAYAFNRNAADVVVQSGRPASILQGLRRLGVDIEEFFPLHCKSSSRATMQKAGYRLFGKYHRGDRDEQYLQAYAKKFDVLAKNKKFDLVFSPGSEVLTYLQTEQPITFCADATFANLVNYYWDFTNLSVKYLRKGHAQEKAALERASLAIYPSEWAAKSAIEDYGAAPEKVIVIPFGANLGKNNSAETVTQWIQERPMDQLRLLFVGRHWERKGGDIAVETVRLLRKAGLPATLDVAGCSLPSKYRNFEWINAHGSLEVSNSSKTEQLSYLFSRTHFVLVPSRAEAYGLTFCEANAFGVPAVASATGGISSIIIDQRNGLLLPKEADPQAFANAIEAAFANPDRYRTLCSQSFTEFEQRLNWNTFCKKFLETVKQRLPGLGANTEITHPKKPIRAAYVTNQFLDPDSANSWSGLPYYIKRSIEAAGVEFISISGEKESGKAWRIIQFLAWRLLARKRFLRFSDSSYLKHLGRQAALRIKESEVEIVFSPSTWAVAYLETDLPTVFWTDATFAGVLGFYQSFDNLAPPSIRDGNAADQAALDTCARAIYSSDWAADSAREKYGVEGDKLVVVPFGANFEPLPTREDVMGYIAARPEDFCEILLVGVDWERKGAGIAVETLVTLTKRNLKSRLTIVGCEPPKGVIMPENVEIIPFLNKKTPEGRQRLNEIFARSHFFLMPSRADCTPVVYSEANSFGVPCLTTNVGGIPTIVRNQINGQLFPLTATGHDYADAVIKLISNREDYSSLALRSQNEAQSRLSWMVSGQKVASIFREVIREHAANKGAVK